MIFNENYGWITRQQNTIYRVKNVSPADHDMLVDVFGEDSDAIIAAVNNCTHQGMFNAYLFSQTLRR